MSFGTSVLGLTSQLLIVSLLSLKTFYRHGSIDTNEDQLTDIYDYIVVGSGSAGAIVAHRLAQDGHTRVLLLEAGGPTSLITDIPAQATTGRHFSSRYDWNYTMEPQFVGRGYLKGRIPDNRGFAIGGTSSINTMIFNRGNARDYDAWQYEYGAVGWSYKDVLPFFMRYEGNRDPLIVNQNPGFHGIYGPIGITSYAKPDPLMLIHQDIVNREAGIHNTDINGPVQAGTAISQAFIDLTGIRSSASNAYIDPNPFPKNLNILTSALVTKILFEGKTAVGVILERKGHAYRVLATKEVIISAGAINTPQLLMLSGIGPAQHLQQFHIPVVKDLPVGDNLMNHPGVNFNFLIKPSSRKLINIPGLLTTGQLYQYLTSGSGPLSTHHRTLTYFSTESNKDKEWPNFNFEMAIYQFPQNLSDFTQFRYERAHEWKQYLSKYLGRFYMFTHPILQRVRSRGFIRLASSNPHVPPRINPMFLTHPQDMQDFVDGLKAVLQFYELSSISQHLEPLSPVPGCKFCPNKRYIYECESYIRCVIEGGTYGSYHVSGGARMGAVERSDVVVDPYLRVKGIERLRVCDASIIPLLPNSNTNAASLMIGEKCAQLIKDQSN